ncbi:MAG: co-chaperone GroES [Planctomycetia bacterium]|nr:co-chaperone GroES [Planctomycetia bacterium]
MAKKKCCEGSCCGESKINIQPLGDRIVVQRDEAETVSAGGIYLPETAKNKPARGKVICVGNGKVLKDGTRCELQVKPGDHVLFLSYAGEEFKLNDQEYLLLREEDLLAVIG